MATTVKEMIKTIKEIKLNPALLDEYGLNPVTFRLLRLASQIYIYWSQHHEDLKEISGQPANSLRKLVDRSLLVGPLRGDKITYCPFTITEMGRETLAEYRKEIKGEKD
jgi:hypothetical protein